MKSYDSQLVFWVVTGVVGFVAGSAVKWISSKFRKVDETEGIKAKLDNHIDDYKEFKTDTKGRLDRLDERTYEQKK